jgi:hypothetical protein
MATKCDMCKTNSIFNNILKITSDEIDLYYELYKSKTLTQIFGKQLFKDNYNIIANDLFYFRYNNLPEVNYINYGIFANLDINKLKLSEFASNEVINDFNRIKNNKARFVIFMTDMYNTIIIPRFGSQLESNKDFKMDDIFTYEITITETSNIFKKYYIIWFSIIISIIIIMIFFSV